MKTSLRPSRTGGWASAILSFLVLFVAACGTLSSQTAFAAEPTVDSIVVKLRSDVVFDSGAGLPAAQRDALTTAMQLPFAHVGYTSDGALRLQFLTPLTLDAARAAVNRARLLRQVLYASLVPTALPPAPNRATAMAVTSPGETAQANPPVRRLIVKFRDPAASGLAKNNQPLPSVQLDRLSALAGQPVAFERAMSGEAFVVRLFQPLAIDQALAVTGYMATDATIEYAEPDRLLQPALVPNDPRYPEQLWNLGSAPAQLGGANLPPAWDITTGSPNINVAVIDTGVLPGHPDLAGRFVGGYDFISDAQVANDGDARDPDASDPGDWVSAQDVAGYFVGCPIGSSSFHGTHVSGIVGAVSNNGVGVSGINWVSPIVPIRVLGKCGGYLSDIADAVAWTSGGSVPGVPANTHPARVMNLSLSGGACDSSGANCTCGTSMQNAVNTALANNAVVVVAAGNQNTDAVRQTPADCNGVITVGAIGHLGQRATYSNYGALVEISAPGGSDGSGVLSTIDIAGQSPDPGRYDYGIYQGTSQATPHVAGIASLMLSVNPLLTPSQVVSKIQTTARPFPTGTIRDCSTALCGAGIVDAGAAVASAGNANGSSTTLSTSGTPATLGTIVTFTATVTGSTPSGTVAFTESTIPLNGCSAVALTGSSDIRTAQCSISTLAVGTHSIVASYSGDGANTPSHSTPLTQVIVTAVQISGTVFVSGGAGLSGVTFSAPGGGSCGSSNASGQYSCSVPNGWSGTVTPAFGGYTFTPTSRSYSNLTQNLTANDYGAVGTSTTVWVEDAVPAGATALGDNESWNWVSANPPPFSGTLAHQSGIVNGMHQHYFVNATTTLSVGVGDTLFTYVYLDPASPPTEIVLQWNDGSWEHRAYWGANQLSWGTDGTPSRRFMGALPAAGQWVRLSVPAEQVGLVGSTLNGMAFSLNGGRATFDYGGKVSQVTFPVTGTVTFNGAGLNGVTLTASGGVPCTNSDASGNYTCTVPQGFGGTITPSLSGYTFTPTSRSYANLNAAQAQQDYAAAVAPTYQLSGTVTFAGSGLSGVSFSAAGISCTPSNASGQYACTAPQGWSGTVTPSLAGYAFSPSARTYNNVVANQPAQDYSAVANGATVWVEDAVPTGATAAGDNETWNWVGSNPAPYSGTLAHQSALAAGMHQHYFYNATATLSVGTGDVLFTYVYLDPANPPTEIVLQWNDGSWEHRAYWGANQINWGVDGTASLRFVGALPASGQWARLEVPAAQVGLEGRTLNGMAFSLNGGRATFDYAGKSIGAPPVTFQLNGTVTFNGSGLGGVSFSAPGGGNCTSSNASGQYSCTVPQSWSGTVTPTLSGYSFTPSSRSYSNVATNQLAQDYVAAVPVTYQISGRVTLNAQELGGGGPLNGVHFSAPGGGSCSDSNSLGLYSCSVPQGWSGTVTPSLGGLYTFTPATRSYTAVAANQTGQDYVASVSTLTIWVDDAVPAGATAAGDNEGWNWVSSNPTPYFGSLAHQSALAGGMHQHYFYNATTTLSVSVGDTLTTYIYLDPVNPPSEIVLQWNDGSWEHRAYWGANQINWGVNGTASLRFMGALPATGQWVRLDVPASQVGLEGRTLNGMAFSLYGGRATFDYAGKSAGAPPPTFQISGTVTLNGSGLSGVSFSAPGGGSCNNSDSSGQYSCTVPQGWSGSVTPSSSGGYTFAPTSRAYSNVAANQPGQDYVATAPVTYQLSGTVTLNGSGLSSVSFGAPSGGSCNNSSASGQYSCTVPQGWSGTITPALSGYSFTPSARTYANVAANQAAQDYVAAINHDTVWVEDAVPAGAAFSGDSEGWNWVGSNPAPFSGSLAHQSGIVGGMHQHYFYGATATLSVGVGDSLFTYVYLDPVNPPTEIVLQWNDGTWEHRAYWGANAITFWGVDGTVSRRFVGALPPTGQWVRLSVPASQVGLEGRTLNGMAFSLNGGRATFDAAGKSSP